MILSFNFEELRALETGAELFLSDHSHTSDSSVAAPVEAYSAVQLLRPRLEAIIEVETLAEQRELRRAVAVVANDLHERMEEAVLHYHPAHEEAVALYFDYAHVFGVLTRIDQMGAEMSAIIELMTGEPVNDRTARSVTFPD